MDKRGTCKDNLVETLAVTYFPVAIRLKIRKSKKIEVFLPHVGFSPKLCVKLPVRFICSLHGCWLKVSSEELWILGAMGVGGWQETSGGQKTK